MGLPWDQETRRQAAEGRDRRDFDFEEQLRDEGFPERETDELLAPACFGIMMNTRTDAIEIPWESPFPPKEKRDSDQVPG